MIQDDAFELSSTQRLAHFVAGTSAGALTGLILGGLQGAVDGGSVAAVAVGMVTYTGIDLEADLEDRNAFTNLRGLADRVLLGATVGIQGARFVPRLRAS